MIEPRIWFSLRGEHHECPRQMQPGFPARRAELTLLLVVGDVAIIGIAGARARAQLAQAYPPPGQLVDIGGYRLHLDCRGEGNPTVVLEAGLNEFSIFWHRVQPEVARFTRVCSYDRAGLGWSNPAPAARDLDTMIVELGRLLTRGGVAPPI